MCKYNEMILNFVTWSEQEAKKDGKLYEYMERIRLWLGLRGGYSWVSKQRTKEQRPHRLLSMLVLHALLIHNLELSPRLNNAYTLNLSSPKQRSLFTIHHIVFSTCMLYFSLEYLMLKNN